MIEAEIKRIIEKYPEMWTKQLYKVGYNLINVNDAMSRNFFVESGILKCFDINDDTLEEIIIAFFTNGDIIFPYRGHEIIPSNVNFQVIEDAVLNSISADNWNIICETEPVTDALLKNQIPVWIMNKMISYIKCNSYPTSAERYKKMITEFPFLLRVKDEDLSKHLGIDRRTIVRIKTKLLLE